MTMPDRRMKGPRRDSDGMYRAKCACGWPGSPWELRRNAVAEFTQHHCWPDDDDGFSEDGEFTQ
jgi:hypothetical protein